MKKIRLAAKSNTVRYGVLGIGTILGGIFNQDFITTVAGDLFSANYAHAIYYALMSTLSVLTGAGVIKGRLDGDDKLRLRDRR